MEVFGLHGPRSRGPGVPFRHREIIAAFDDPLAARRAADELDEAGFSPVRVDQMTQHPRMPSRNEANAGYPDTFTGESDPVARSGLIASTAVSGITSESDPFLGPGSYDPFPGGRYVLTVVLEGPNDKIPALSKEAGEIITRNGGRT